MSGLVSEPDVELGPVSGKAKAVVILAHGRGSNAASMADLARALDRPAIRFICIGASGGTWYPHGFMSPPESNEPWQSQAMAQYGAAIDAVLATGVPLSKLVVGGYSQGACLTMGLLWNKPLRYGAALVFTGGLIGPPGSVWPSQPALKGMRVLLTNGDHDPWVPLSRTLESEKALKVSGARVDLCVYEGHQLESGTAQLEGRSSRLSM